MKHHKRHLLLILGLAGTLATTSSAQASGLQITEQSVTGLGRAFAGGSLPNDDVSAVFYNPADMMLSKGMQAQAGMTFIGISIEADNAGSTTRLPANLGDMLTKPPGSVAPVFVTIPSSGLGNDDGGTDNVVPNGFFAMDINDRMRFGLGMTAPFAVSTSYSRGWVGRYHAVDSELMTGDINPSIAYRINDNLSIGGGVSAQYVDARLTRALFYPGNPDGYVEVKADGWAFGYNLGALYEFDPNTRVSFSYRSRINHSAEGDRTITNYVPGFNGKVSTKADVTLPDWLGLAAYRRINDQWAVMGGVRWTNWSLFKELKLEFANGTQDVTEENWEDSWSFNIGVSYDYNPEWTFRAGYVYDQTPVPSAEFRTPRIPDSNRNAIGLGFSYHPSSQLSLDFGYMYIDFASASTENTVSLIPTYPGLVTDTLRLDYNGSGNLVGIQASYRF